MVVLLELALRLTRTARVTTFALSTVDQASVTTVGRNFSWFPGLLEAEHVIQVIFRAALQEVMAGFLNASCQAACPETAYHAYKRDKSYICLLGEGLGMSRAVFQSAPICAAP